jgi:hypothetical protein
MNESRVLEQLVYVSYTAATCAAAAGTPDGAICSWRGCRCVAVHAAHAKGVLQYRPDGMQSYGGVAALVLLEDDKTLLSGGADG